MLPFFANHRTLLLTFLVLGHLAAYSQLREVVNLRSGWKFSLSGHEDAAIKDFNDTKWQTVSVPHDWAISGPFMPTGDGNTAKLPWKGEGWYRYHLSVPESDHGKRLFLLFDGVMAFPSVYVNGQPAGSWDYGYNSFYIDITDLIHFNESNTIAVHADTRQHDSRWYPGAGIYRKVQLIKTEPIHAAIWGTHITTPVIKSNYTDVNIITTVINQSSLPADEVSVEYAIISPNGKALLTQTTKSQILISGQKKDFETTITLTEPQKWELNNGVLYTVKSIVKNGNKTVDTISTAFGIRTVRFTADNGFYLNDKRVQLKGVCLHHDQGPLGAAFYPRAMERQLQLLKDMGCNAIRTSHNVAAPELLDLCDRMGLLVLDEIFDKYDQKADFLPETDFTEFAHRNVKNWILRDRNHPSVFMWSVGNEIGDVQWNINGGFEKLRTMVNAVHEFDNTRPVTLVCDSKNSAKLRHFDFYDVHSWNYGRRYELARQLEPGKAVIISESASTVSTRGFYEWPLPDKKTNFTKSLQVSSYDLNAPDWAEIPDDDFMWQQEENYVAGEFVWTGFDYLGEPTPYDNDAVRKMGLSDTAASVSSYFGILDLTGIPKDRYYLYKSYWNEDDTTIHILPHWTWPGMEGDSIPVFVYTNGDCAELFLNGKSLGMKCKSPASEKSVERFRLMWNKVGYQPGEMKAVAYKEGEKIGDQNIKTSGEPYQIKLSPDRHQITADGMDLSYVLIEALDKNGNECPTANHLVNLQVKGAGNIAGIGNGNPQSMDSFQSDQVRLFYGKAMLILRSDERKGKIEITATSNGLLQDSATIAVE
jgi:beta-galactosidase